MENAITYILGAGASASKRKSKKHISIGNRNTNEIEESTLPIVSEIPERLLNFKNFMISMKDDRFSEETVNTDHIIDLIIEFQDLISRHASIDTLAKKYWISGETEKYKRLKMLLTLFLGFEELKFGNINLDPRYDLFFAGLMNKNRELPKNLKLLSWNYDSQIEYSLKGFYANSSITEVERNFNIKPAHLSGNVNNGFGVYKLNGTLGTMNLTEGTADSLQLHTDQMDFEENEQYYDYVLTKKIVDMYDAVVKGSENIPLITFSWETMENENEGVLRDTFQLALEAIKDTEILVVIGYTFPFFNREVDRQILNKMTRLEKVYVQAPEGSQEDIKDAFFSIHQGFPRREYFSIASVKQFYIPPKFDTTHGGIGIDTFS